MYYFTKLMIFIDEQIRHQKGKLVDYLNKKDDLDPEDIEEDIKTFRDERHSREKSELEEVSIIRTE